MCLINISTKKAHCSRQKCSSALLSYRSWILPPFPLDYIFIITKPLHYCKGFLKCYCKNKTALRRLNIVQFFQQLRLVLHLASRRSPDERKLNRAAPKTGMRRSASPNPPPGLSNRLDTNKQRTICAVKPCAGADVDSVWERNKRKARKRLENRAESPASSARFIRLPCQKYVWQTMRKSNLPERIGLAPQSLRT